MGYLSHYAHIQIAKKSNLPEEEELIDKYAMVLFQYLDYKALAVITYLEGKAGAIQYTI